MPVAKLKRDPAAVCDFGRDSVSILHDLRNPLSAIHSAAEIMLDADLSPAHVKRLAGNICNAAGRIHEMLQEMLGTSRGERGEPEECCLYEVARIACDSLSANAESHGTALVVEIRPGIELPLQRSRMIRAFVNLILNAIEAMPKGGEVRIAAEVAGDSVTVHVDDTGPGIASEIRSKVFQPFVTVGKRHGLGLGLAFTRQTVLEHGGELWIDRAPGGGARFSMRLPVANLPRR